MRIGNYSITEMENGNYWIAVIDGDHEGEGMEANKERFEQLIEDYYTDEF